MAARKRKNWSLVGVKAGVLNETQRTHPQWIEYYFDYEFPTTPVSRDQNLFWERVVAQMAAQLSFMNQRRANIYSKKHEGIGKE